MPRPQSDAFERRPDDGREFTREQWLRAVFRERIEFSHRKEPFYYVPADRDETDPIIAGRIGRRVTVAENDAPEDGLVDIQRPAWKAVIVMIDPMHHANGQRVAIQNSPMVGLPISLFQSIASLINSRPEPYFVEVNPIVSSESFWDFAESNKGEVTFVEFEFVAPNMFGHADDYDKEIRDMQAKELIQKSKLSLESKNGLNLHTPRIKGAVDYTSKGAGSIRAKTKRRRRFHSNNKSIQIDIPKKDVSETTESGLIALIKSKFRR